MSERHGIRDQSHRDSTDDTSSYWDNLARNAGMAAAIDPKDRRGNKNAYISAVRDLALLGVLRERTNDGAILDFGCGTGTFLSALLDHMPGRLVAGVDVSRDMLGHALARDHRLSGRLVAYDGARLPFQDDAWSAITTAGALLYARYDDEFDVICREFKRILAFGGVVACVEQFRRRDTWDDSNLKRQRTPDAFKRAFIKAGFEAIEFRQLRRGRFPLLYAIRYGLVPPALIGPIARLECAIRARSTLPLFDYADALFVFRKPVRSSAP